MRSATVFALLSLLLVPTASAAATSVTARPKVQRPYGPLSTIGRCTETPWDERKRAMRRNEARLLSKQEITEDLALLSRIIDLFLVPRTAEQHAGIQNRDQAEMRLKRLAPYSVASTFNSIIHPAGPIDYCARPPGEEWPCNLTFKARSPTDLSQPPYNVSMLPSKIGRLVIRDSQWCMGRLRNHFVVHSVTNSSPGMPAKSTGLCVTKGRP